MMAKEASTCLFSSLLFLLVICCYAEVGEVAAEVEKSLENSIGIANKVAELYVEASTMVDFVFSRRKLLIVKRTSQHDVIFPPNNPTPNIVTVPATNPANMSAPIPTTTPVTVPSMDPNNPTTVPITNPVSTPAPAAVPGTGAGTQQPVTNPVTTYPAPTGGVPVSTPVTNPVTTYPAPTGGVPVSTPVTNPVPNPVPPTTINAPAVPGQSWCIARTGASETMLQSALDYACGTGGADCSQIQQGGNCYNPNSLQNHASCAFNSYYQKNPAPTSCDFGGTATIVNTNPSTGSCIYPSSGSQSTPTATPATSTTGAGVPGSVTPPSVLNSSTPGSSAATTSVFGSDTPPGISTSTSMSVGLQPTFSRIILLTMTSFVARLI
ncbi:glucan endo-1,3-beta-glucosidase 3-like [Hibiscus syriacus]|nr:glucan endo-1,3-beta-glucosidase 3-like [Hibiscus syriacus]